LSTSNTACRRATATARCVSNARKRASDDARDHETARENKRRAYHLGDDAVHAALGGERQVALVQDLGLTALHATTTTTGRQRCV
jgi:hypothetical protein